MTVRSAGAARLRGALRALILVAAGAVPAAAAGPGDRAAGTYERRGAYAQSAKIVVLDGSGRFAGSFSTGISGCGGGVDATGHAVSASEIVFTKRDDGGGLCRITVRFAPNYGTATVSEDGCLYWHGAACDFEGTLQRTAQ